HDLEAIKAKIDENTKVIFIANPNNPTGTWLKKAELFAFLKGVPKNIVVVVDEAYLEYVEEEQYASAIELIDELPNLVVTRTFSKAYGLAGLRIGYGVSSADITNLLNRARQPFNANALALAAATAALADDEHIKKSVENNSRGLKQLTGFFDDNGIGYIPSVGNFICVKVGDKAAEIYEALLRAGIIVRPVDNYGMGQYLRLTVGLPEQNQRMMQTIKELMEK
ncbi:MAG: aminotransferase class I/II-fold pyridoxal phosphate-dependent enzyme, partial [Gammaproteobacteria bacterium]